MKRDLYHQIVPAKVASGSAVDLAGSNGNLFFAVTGSTNHTATLAITESDDNSTFTAVDAKHLIGDTAATSSVPLCAFSYVGDCRYLKITATESDVTLFRVAGDLANTPNI